MRKAPAVASTKFEVKYWEIYQEGHRAQKIGAGPDECPYRSTGTNQARYDWITGWCEAYLSRHNDYLARMGVERY